MEIIATPLTLEDLALPAPSKSGWPWTQQSQPLPEQMFDGSEWPRISIVTPSYNQGHFIEETIRSVLLQGYSNLEYIIIDGGSSDNSVEIIKKYEQYLSYWVSEPDKGPTDAINKGWQKTSGEIIAYLNSDDAYLPGALAAVAEAFQQQLDAKVICGNELKVNSEGFVIEESNIKTSDRLSLLNLNFISQPATFVKKSALDLAGGIDLSIKYTFDFELWLRITRLNSIKCIPNLIAITRWHNDTITLTRRSEIGSELVRVIHEEMVNYPSGLTLNDKQQILFQVNCLAMRLHFENKRIFGATKYALVTLWLSPSFRLQLGIIKQYCRNLLKLIRCFDKKPDYTPVISEQIHWSCVTKLEVG
jgi:glycosyltransferase involved in cell wall biosynthesis